MTDVKICGLTRSEDVELACQLGAAYVGFVFASISPRHVRLDEARGLAAAVRPGVTRVGIFIDEDYGFIREAADAGRLDLAQIHRPLEQEDLERISLPVMAVARVTGGAARVPSPETLARCRSILFDTAFGEGERGGGTGARFDWNLLAGKSFCVPLFLAGGLNPENVGEAIARIRPAVVDVASGVEKAPGIKDQKRMEQFFRSVRQADARFGRQGGAGAG